MTLIYLSLFWLAGVCLGFYAKVDPRILLVTSLLAVAIAFLLWRIRLVRLSALCLALVALGLLRYQSALPSLDYGSVALHIGPRAVELGGIVVSEPDVRDQDVRVVVSTYHIGNGQDSYKVSGLVQVRLPRNGEVRYGDDLLLKGTLQDPPTFDDFSYKRYLLHQGIVAIMYHPQVSIIDRDQGNRLLALLYNFRQRLQASIVSYLPEPQAGLTEGVLLGVKAVISDQLAEDLTRTGLTHIIVVSGYNLAVVAALMQKLCEKRLRRDLALLLALVGVVAFTLMTGASLPVIRAAIMISMVLLARAAGRESDALTSLLFAAAALVAISPLTLWDVSFQLSFLATAGLVILSPTMERALQRLPFGIGAILATTIAAQIMTLPVIAFNFQRISLVSPLANLLVQPAIPLMMLSGAVVAFTGLTGLALVRIFGWVTWLFSTYAVQVIHVLGGLPRAAIDIPVLPNDVQTAGIIAYFAVFALIFYLANYVQQGDIRGLPQRIRALPVRDWWRMAVVMLAEIAIVVWLAALVFWHNR